MRPPIEQMQQQIVAINPALWRAEFDEDGSLVIWFHANLNEDPRRIIISLCLDENEQPSANERAAAEFLVSSREYVRDLIGYVEKLEQVYREARALLRNPARSASAQKLYDAIQDIETGK